MTATHVGGGSFKVDEEAMERKTEKIKKKLRMEWFWKAVMAVEFASCTKDEHDVPRVVKVTLAFLLAGSFVSMFVTAFFVFDNGLPEKIIAMNIVALVTLLAILFSSVIPRMAGHAKKQVEDQE